MKSPEQMGGAPEQYDKAKWKELKQRSGESFAIIEGKKIGVPQEELDRFAQDVIAKEIKNHNYGSVYRFMKNMGIGTPEEIKTAGDKAYQFFLGEKEFDLAMGIAEDLYGNDSKEWQRANEANEAEWKKTETRERKKEETEDEGRGLRVSLSKDATFADLFKAIDSLEEGTEELHFEEELWDNFDAEIVEEILSFRDAQAGKAAKTKLIDFFKKRGYSQSDIAAFLPIKFKRERKSRGV